MAVRRVLQKPAQTSSNRFYYKNNSPSTCTENDGSEACTADRTRAITFSSNQFQPVLLHPVLQNPWHYFKYKPIETGSITKITHPVHVQETMAVERVLQNPRH